MAAKIKKGDKVVVMTGRDKGKTGEVRQVMPDDGRAIGRRLVHRPSGLSAIAAGPAALRHGCRAGFYLACHGCLACSSGGRLLRCCRSKPNRRRNSPVSHRH